MWLDLSSGACTLVSFTVQLSQCCFLADGTFDTLFQSFHAFYVTFNASPFGDCVDF